MFSGHIDGRKSISRIGKNTDGSMKTKANKNTLIEIGQRARLTAIQTNQDETKQNKTKSFKNSV